MKKLFVLGILAIVGSVGYGYWHESKLVTQQAPWPEKVLLEYRGTAGSMRTYRATVKFSGRVTAAGISNLDATYTLDFNEKIGKAVGADAFEVEYTFGNVNLDANNLLKPLLAQMPMTKSIVALKGQRVSAIRHATGRIEYTGGASAAANDFTVRSMLGSENVDAFPKEPLARGGAWETRTSMLVLKNQMADFQQVDKYRCAKVTTVMENLSPQGAAATGRQAKINVSSTTFFDYTHGTAVRQEARIAVSDPRGVDVTTDVTVQLISEGVAAPPA